MSESDDAAVAVAAVAAVAVESPPRLPADSSDASEPASLTARMAGIGADAPLNAAPAARSTDLALPAAIGAAERADRGGDETASAAATTAAQTATRSVTSGGGAPRASVAAVTAAQAESRRGPSSTMTSVSMTGPAAGAEPGSAYQLRLSMGAAAPVGETKRTAGADLPAPDACGGSSSPRR